MLYRFFKTVCLNHIEKELQPKDISLLITKEINFHNINFKKILFSVIQIMWSEQDFVYVVPQFMCSPCFLARVAIAIVINGVTTCLRKNK